MGLKVNGQGIAQPYLNGQKMNAYIDGQKVWSASIPKPVAVPLGQVVFLKDDAAMIAAWKQYRSPEVWTEIAANEYLPHVSNTTAAQAGTTQFGANTVALTLAQLPSHTHTIRTYNLTTQGTSGSGELFGRGGPYYTGGNQSGGNNPAGSGQAHNNRPLSHAVRAFRRTA